jgi:hypothetical protein
MYHDQGGTSGFNGITYNGDEKWGVCHYWVPDRNGGNEQLPAPASATPASAFGSYTCYIKNAEYVDVGANMKFPYTSPSTANVATTVTYVAVDSTGLVSACNVTVRVDDDEPPTLQDCSGLDVLGVTDFGENFGTIGAGDSVPLVYPTVSDNSGEEVLVTASVSGGSVTEDTHFPYVGAGMIPVVCRDQSTLDIFEIETI